jgi:5'-nucleotidase/UDP-sugar diphosphatase
MRTLKSMLLVTLLLAAFFLTGATQTHIVLMHTNDIHGHVLPENGVGGLAVIAAIVKQQHPDILLDAGDMFTGTLVSDTFYGESVMAVMNRMGYRASILGNHEFDYGLKTLRDRVRQARFPVLSANVVLPYDDVRKTRVIPIKGIRFGLVGLTTEETPTTEKRQGRPVSRCRPNFGANSPIPEKGQRLRHRDWPPVARGGIANRQSVSRNQTDRQWSLSH